MPIARVGEVCERKVFLATMFGDLGMVVEVRDVALVIAVTRRK